MLFYPSYFLCHNQTRVSEVSQRSGFPQYSEPLILTPGEPPDVFLLRSGLWSAVGDLTMTPSFLLPETVAQKNGSGSGLDLGSAAGKPLLLTLGITRIVEQESLDVDIQGSADGATWTDKPILRFPQKFYCGTYSLLLDLSKHPDVKYLRVTYKLNRWGRGDTTPLFGFYVFAEEAAVVSTMHSAVA
jgi:hypothetical protein